MDYLKRYDKAVLLIGLCLLATGCTVGPDYHKPDSSLPQSWFHSTEKMPEADSKASIEEAWWHRFNDPVLDALINKAVAGNFDIKIAEARIAQARAARSSASADLLPTVNTEASALRQGNRIAFPGTFDLTKPFNTFQTGFDASWELDLFGGKRRTVEADTATLSAAEATRDDLRVSLLAEVARTYMDIRQYQRQLALTKDTVASEQKTVGIASERYRVGDTSQFDVRQAKAQLEQFLTQIPYYENLLTQSELSMDVLLGEQSGATHAMVAEIKPVPVADQALVLAAPAQVIANRPDIRVAEQQLIAATAEQGVAVAQLFPDVSLSGFLGFLNVDSGKLLQGTSKSWSVGGNVLWPILNYGKLSANIDAADAHQQEALATYQKAIITALSDVNKSATSYVKQEEFRAALQKTVADNREVTSIARQRYRQGLSSFVDVLEAQRTLYASENQLAQSNALVSQALIAVYKSLGGGWKDVSKPPEPPVSVSH